MLLGYFTAIYFKKINVFLSVSVDHVYEKQFISSFFKELEPEIAEVSLRNPMLSHTSASAPQFLNVLRVCDVPDVLGMLAPRPLTIREGKPEFLKKVEAIYSAAGAAEAARA